MTSAPMLRQSAAKMRERASRASAEHSQLASELRQSCADNVRKSLELQAGIADCQTRRFRQWAERLEEAAYELENP